MSTAASPPAKGVAWVKWIGALAALIVTGASGYVLWERWSQEQWRNEPMLEGITTKPGTSAPFNSRRPDPQDIASSDVTYGILFPTPEQGWTLANEVKVGVNRSGRSWTVTPKGQTNFGPEGEVLPPPPNAPTPPGRVVEWTTGGSLIARDPADDSPLTGQALVFAALDLLNDPGLWAAGRTVETGERWEVELAGDFGPGSSATYSVRYEMRYEGLVERDGESFARVTARAKSLLEALPVETLETPIFRRATTTKWRKTDAKFDVLYEPETGRAVMMMQEGRVVALQEVATHMKGRSDPPMVRENGGENFIVRVRAEWEYAS